jgi:hypothetical protein
MTATVNYDQHFYQVEFIFTERFSVDEGKNENIHYGVDERLDEI